VRLAIVHYHLRAGGVSRIIDLAVKALQTEGYLDGVHQVAVIAGSAPHARSLLDRRCVGVVPELNYSEGCGDVASLGKALDEEARRILGGVPISGIFTTRRLEKIRWCRCLPLNGPQRGERW